MSDGERVVPKTTSLSTSRLCGGSRCLSVRFPQGCSYLHGVLYSEVTLIITPTTDTCGHCLRHSAVCELLSYLSIGTGKGAGGCLEPGKCTEPAGESYPREHWGQRWGLKASL